MVGIYLTKGSTLRIPSFTINLNTGEASEITPEIGLDVYPLWLRSAIRQARESEAVSSQLQAIWGSQDDPSSNELIEMEVVASMGAIVASAAALDAFYGSVLDRSNKPVPPAARIPKRRRAREKIIVSTFQQRFALRNKGLENLRTPMRDIFRYRHAALHAHGRPEVSVLHPRLQVGMSQKHVMFRSENAVAATSFALTVISWLSTRPHPRYAKLREHCRYAREWLQPLLEDWEADHAPLGLELPLAERLPGKATSRTSASATTQSASDQTIGGHQNGGL